MKGKIVFGLFLIISVVAVIYFVIRNNVSKVNFKDQSFQYAFDSYYLMPQYEDNNEGKDKLIPTKKQLKSMQSLRLDFSGKLKFELHDLDKFPNLKYLYIIADTLTDDQIKFISEMENLEILFLLTHKNNNNYNSLKNLKHLKQLVLSGCDDNTIKFVSDIPGLELFGLYESDISNLDFLDSQKNLKSLYLNFVTIQTISSVKNLHNIETLVAFHLDIKENGHKLLAEINPKVLDLQFCYFIKDINFLKNMNNLEDITFYEINITNLSILNQIEHFPKFRKIFLLPKLEKENLEILEELEPILKERQDIYLAKKKITPKWNSGNAPRVSSFLQP